MNIPDKCKYCGYPIKFGEDFGGHYSSDKVVLGCLCAEVDISHDISCHLPINEALEELLDKIEKENIVNIPKNCKHCETKIRVTEHPEKDDVIIGCCCGNINLTQHRHRNCSIKELMEGLLEDIEKANKK